MLVRFRVSFGSNCTMYWYRKPSWYIFSQTLPPRSFNTLTNKVSNERWSSATCGRWAGVSQRFLSKDATLYLRFYLCIGQEATEQVSVSTIVAERVQYFVLLNYSYKSWSIIKTRDSFGICSSWVFQNCLLKLNLTKILLM